MSDSKQHSRLGSSSLYRILKCAASVRLSEGLENVSSKAADKGSAAHALGELCLLEGKDSANFIGHVFKDYPDYPVDEDMAEAVQAYLDAVNAAKAEMGVGTELFLEHKFDLTWLHPDLGGTNDASLVSLGEILWVFDYKHGYEYVNHVENPQMMSYALGALHEHLGMFTEVRMTIVQPNLPNEKDAVRTYSTTPEKIYEFAERLLVMAEEVNAGTSEPVAGDHCKYCLAKRHMKCPAFSEHKFNIARNSFAGYLQTNELVLPEPQDISPEWLSQILDAANAFNDWIKTVEEYAIRQAQRGIIPPDYKLVKANTKRKWKDDALAEMLLSLELGEEVYAARKLLSPNQIEKLLKKNKSELDISDLYQKPEGGLTLVKISDARPAETVKTVAEIFQTELQQLS